VRAYLERPREGDVDAEREEVPRGVVQRLHGQRARGPLARSSLRSEEAVVRGAFVRVEPGGGLHQGVELYQNAGECGVRK
jgi:hypothetical protein